MKINTKLLTALSISVLLANGTQAQEAWDLTRCIDYAIAHNLTVKQQEAARDKSEVELNTAKWSRLPDLNGSASHSFNFGRSLQANTTYQSINTQNTGLNLSTSVPLFTGMQIPNNIALSKLNLKAATEDLNKAKEDISIEVASAYLQVLFNEEQVKIARQQVELSQEMLTQKEAYFKYGKASVAVWYEAKSRVAQDQLSLVQTENAYRLSLLALTQLLELPSPEGFAIIRPDAGGIDPSAGAVPPSPDEIYQEAITFKPEIKAELYRLKSTEMNIKIAQSALLPTLSLNAGIGSNYYKTSGFKAESFGRQMRNNFSQYIGLSLNVPIFNRFATRNSIRSAKLERETQQLQLDNVRKNLYKEIQQAYYNTIAARAKYESSMEASRSNKAAFDLMSAKYEYGKANITEFNEAKNNWLKAESDLVIAKYEYVYDTSLIDFYRGKELDF